MFNNINELTIQIDEYNSDVIYISETWLTENISNEAVHIPGFTRIRKDCWYCNLSGGVAIYIPVTWTRNDI